VNPASSTAGAGAEPGPRDNAGASSQPLACDAVGGLGVNPASSMAGAGAELGPRDNAGTPSQPLACDAVGGLGAKLCDGGAGGLGPSCIGATSVLENGGGPSPAQLFWPVLDAAVLSAVDDGDPTPPATAVCCCAVEAPSLEGGGQKEAGTLGQYNKAGPMGVEFGIEAGGCTPANDATEVETLTGQATSEIFARQDCSGFDASARPVWATPMTD
jgi:hypothetical protein